MIGIVGGGLAAAKVVEGYREAGGTDEIALWSQDPHGPYHRPPLSKRLLRGESKPRGRARASGRLVRRARRRPAARRARSSRSTTSRRTRSCSRPARGRASSAARSRSARSTTRSSSARPRRAREDGDRDRRRLHRLRGHGVADAARRPGDADRARPDASSRRSRRRRSPRRCTSIYREHGVDLRLEATRDPGRRHRRRRHRRRAERRARARRRPRGAERRRRRRALRDRRAPASTRSATSPSSSTRSIGRHRRIEHWSNAAYHGTTLGKILAGDRTRATTSSRRSSRRSSGVASSPSATPPATTPPRSRATSPGDRAVFRFLQGGADDRRRRDRASTTRSETALKDEIRAGAASSRHSRYARREATLRGGRWRTRRSNSSPSTRSGRCRWTRCRRRTPAIPARRWRSRRSRTCSTREVMRHNPASPHWPNRDRFVLSAGHACVLQYSRAPPRRATTSRSRS